ncbi:uncharacterized protein LOC128862909 isoform X1 [Anastrepha ludens]|uniref:uncharacterized protein LOC128862909 isoform X1 n=1 Tax=Anastrepha ludens TaxID=28586 RepID=UPI0023AFE5F0|nr:uncharacterized protein LOC128862909 isoform X1 [Anastrepha ludens]
MQAEKFLLTRFARTCLRLIQTKQKQTCQQQSLLSQLEKQRKPFHVLGGIKLDINTIFTANAGNVAGDFSQRRYQHYLLPRFQNKQPNSHSNLVSCYNNDNNNVNFRQQKANIYTQSTTPLRGKYPTDTVHEPLCSERARELVYKLKDSEREAIKVALLKYDSERQRLGLEGKLAATQWRTRFGRPSQVPRLGDVDPTGRFCAFPEDWLKQKAAAKAPAPTMADLRRICVVNAVPFLAFGFLDNFVMIVAGDSIESIFGAFMCISTMAAAGLGNTVSDILGIGSAYYVERGCEMMGFRLPDLTPIQMEMKSSRHAANLGRIVGITIGCLLGMMPLMFMKKKDKTENVAVNEDANVIGVTPVKC